MPVGWSGHERGVAVTVAAAAFGADIIERHFTLDRTMDGPDQRASIEPDGLKKLVERVRAAEEAYGDPYWQKRPTRGELQTQEILGKSLCARQTILEGEEFGVADLEARSPGRGVNPAVVLGFPDDVRWVATRNMVIGEHIEAMDLKCLVVAAKDLSGVK